MKKKYETPILEKITFDYTIQTTAASNCFESVMNVREGASVGEEVPIGQCVSGMVIYIGWTDPQTGVNN